jgi:hypothetical protein
LPEDSEAALEWAEWRASLCPNCRFPKDESMDPAAAEGPGRPGRYDAKLVTCQACAERDRKSKVIAGDETFDTSGVFIAVVEAANGDGYS